MYALFLNRWGTGYADIFDVQTEFRVSGNTVLTRESGGFLYIGNVTGQTGPISSASTGNLMLIGDLTEWDDRGEDMERSTALGYGAKITTSDTIQLGADNLTKVRIGRLGDFATTQSGNSYIPLCLNPDTKEISHCSTPLSQGNQNKFESQQKLINKQQAIINQQKEQLNKHEKQIEALIILVCSQNPTAKVCAEKEENNEES